MRAPLRAAIVGCGNVSERYFQAGARFADFDVVACADLVEERAGEKASRFPGVEAISMDALFNDPAIEMLINLTIPAVHGELALRALQAGKHVYGEKPLARSTEEGRQVLNLASAQGLRTGSAPDTFLGAGIQTARKILDDGWIGRPVAATAFMQCHGHEHWHPDPAFYYQKGGGPLFDMGPYYLTALINLFGPVKNVTAMTAMTFPERVVGSGEKAGERIAVEVPTHVAGTLEFHCGALATLVMSFDIWHHSMPHLEVHGTTGSMRVPDPNTFGGEVLLSRGDSGAWSAVPHSHGYPTEARGIGIADMAAAIRREEPHRASGELAFHVLEIMESLHRAAELGRQISLTSRPARPEAFFMDLQDGSVRP